MSGPHKTWLEEEETVRGLLDRLAGLHGLSLLVVPPGAATPPHAASFELGAPGQPLGRLVAAPAPTGELARLLPQLAALLSRLCQAESEMDSIARELSSRYEEINLMFRVGEHLKGLSAGERALTSVLEESVAALECDCIVLCLPQTHVFLQAGPSPLDRSAYPPETLVAALSPHFERQEALITLGPQEGGPWRGLGLSVHSSIAFPVRVEGKRAGLLACLSLGRKVFSNSNVSLMRALASQLSIVLTNHKLIQNMKDFLLEVVVTLVSVIEAKDRYTRGHSERVQAMSLAVGEAMGLEPEAREDLRWAAILHDIGKIGIPDTILCKPGRLTDEEFAIIKRHPDRGVDILRHLASLAHILPAIRHHHERWDGRGYPLGLRGEDIPLLARIIAVGDTFDAITSTRAYRVARSPAEALGEIERVAGTQLDAHIASVFVEMCRQDLGSAIMTPLSQLGRELPLGESCPLKG